MSFLFSSDSDGQVSYRESYLENSNLRLEEQNKQLQNELRYLIEICEANLINLDSDLRFQYAKKLAKKII